MKILVLNQSKEYMMIATTAGDGKGGSRRRQSSESFRCSTSHEIGAIINLAEQVGHCPNKDVGELPRQPCGKREELFALEFYIATIICWLW